MDSSENQADLSNVPYLLRAGPLVIAILLIPVAFYVEHRTGSPAVPTGDWNGTLHAVDGSRFSVSVSISPPGNPDRKKNGTLTLRKGKKRNYRGPMEVRPLQNGLEMTGSLEINGRSPRFHFLARNPWSIENDRRVMYGTCRFFGSETSDLPWLPSRGTWILRRRSSSSDDSASDDS